MVAGDHHDFSPWQRSAQPRELDVRVDDRGIRRAHLVEHVSGHEHDIGRNVDDLVHRALERLRHVRFTLIDAARSQPLILAEPEVQVGEVDESQGGRGRRRMRATGGG